MQCKKRLLLFTFILTLSYIFWVIAKPPTTDNLKNNQFRNTSRYSKISSFILPTYVHKYVTLVIRHSGFDELVPSLFQTISSYQSVYPTINILIVTDVPIVQFAFKNQSSIKNVQQISLNIDLLHLVPNRNPLEYVKTKYIFVVPEGSYAINPPALQHLLLSCNDDEKCFLSVPIIHSHIKCTHLTLNLREWSIAYQSKKGSDFCDSVSSTHGIVLGTSSLRQIGEPFMLPFPEALYIQTAAQGLFVKILNHVQLNFTVQLSSKAVEKINYMKQNQRTVAHIMLKIKKVTRENGMTEWYGCTRNTSRCFNDVENSMPKYLFEGRWTPPCCLKVLRDTAKYTFSVLERCGVRYWLEGGSLLGAVRHSDIIPWDYDVDVGVYKEDINKCPWLRNIENNIHGALMDPQGFIWERSKPEEGNFFRVQASNVNHLHVDIFPFYPKNGIMTKDTWFTNHPQDKEFPERFLKPLTTIEFVGVHASAPNSIREFLELKFGKGVIENPQYPQPKLLPFPNDLPTPITKVLDDGVVARFFVSAFHTWELLQALVMLL